MSTECSESSLDQTVASGDSSLPISRLAASFGYWLLAHFYFLPGLYLQRYSTQLGLSLLMKRRSNLPRNLVYHLAAGTLDSTKYFEFDFAWRSLPSETAGLAYLDVHSHWLLPLLLAKRRKIPRATVVSKNDASIPILRYLFDAADLESQCQIIEAPLDRSSLGLESFDLITSISGLAEASDDSALAAAMWSLLKPGGRLVVSLPCANETRASTARYDLRGAAVTPDSPERRIYNSQLLQERIFRVVGEPQSSVIYGAIAGHDSATKDGAQHKHYPSPREPLVMAREWRCFPRIEDLPREGIIAMTFAKPVPNERPRNVAFV
jgi:SAM-dependent methyltransferase